MNKLAMMMVALLGCAPVLAQTTDPWPPATRKEQVQWQTPPDTTQEGYSTPNIDPDFASKIVFFPGHVKKCRDMLGGLLKCCREPVPDTQKDWWSIYSKNVRQGLAGELACAGQQTGNWQQYNSGASTATFQTEQGSFTSNSETVNGNGTPVQCSGGNRMRDTQQQYMDGQETNTKPNLSWYCNDEEFQLATMRNTGECHLIGKKCSTRVLGFCVIEKEVFCCFNSPISRMIRESMLAPGQNFGTPSNPQCDGISAAQFQSMDLNKVDLNETVARMGAGDFPPLVDGHDMESEMTGGGSTIGNQGRETATQRSFDRVNHVNVSGSQAAITANESVTLPSTNTNLTPSGAGQISFTQGVDTWYCAHGNTQYINVQRNGGAGTVSATLSLDPGSSWLNGAWIQTFQPIVVTWGSGDTSTKKFPVQFMPNNVNDVMYIDFDLSSPSGGATITPWATYKIEWHNCNLGVH